MKTFCFFHYDVDGVVSYLALKWLKKNEAIEYRTSTPRGFKEDWVLWSAQNDVSSYDKIYILDLDVHEHAEFVDIPNVVIIDHHKSHEYEYKKASALIKVYSSNAKLIYKIMTKLHPEIELTDAQKKLIIIADDFDSYTLKLKESKQLDSLFWNTQKAVEMFIKWFITGYRGFNIQQQTIINQHLAKVNSVRENLSVYSATLKIQGKERYVCAGFAHTCINDVADILIEEYNAEMAIVVNLKRQSISIRRPAQGSNVDVAKFAETVCDGGGHEYAAGGSVTDKFMQFTKVLKQIK